LAPFSVQSFGQQLFIVTVVVIRRVNEVDAEIDASMDDVNVALFVRVVELALKCRAAITDGRDFQTFLAEITILHVNEFFSAVGAGDSRFAVRSSHCDQLMARHAVPLRKTNEDFCRSLFSVKFSSQSRAISADSRTSRVLCA
jgi:hypothetical protein